jgi:TRAP-type uncharacterized transport system substrate-binding protein
MTSIVEPRIDRGLDIRMLGDWGMANFHRVCGWLSQELGSHSAPGSRFAIYNGTGGSDALLRVHARDVDIAVTTPASFATMGIAGVGPYAGTPMDDLRALAVLPQRDRLAFAIDPKFGVTTFAELRAAKPKLRISVCTQDEGNLIGFATAKLLEACGVENAECIAFARPELSLGAAVADPSIDAVVQEAIMTPWWRDVLAKRGFRFLPLEPAALARLESAYGWHGASIAAGFFDDQPADVPCLEFSDFLVFTHADLPDDVARCAAWALTETRELFERQYRHIPVDRSPVTYPLDPVKMANAPIPLHPGALAHYREAGYIH